MLIRECFASIGIGRRLISYHKITQSGSIHCSRQVRRACRTSGQFVREFRVSGCDIPLTFELQ